MKRRVHSAQIGISTSKSPYSEVKMMRKVHCSSEDSEKRSASLEVTEEKVCAVHIHMHIQIIGEKVKEGVGEKYKKLKTIELERNLRAKVTPF
jgi:hypothetical protein